MCVCHVHWMDCKAAACSVSCTERVLPSLCQTHCCLTVTEDSTPMLGWTITLPFVQAAQKCRCQRARLMLLGNTTCCALVYSSSSSVLCVYTSPFSRGGWGGGEVVAVLIQSGLAKTAFLWQLCWYCTESCDAATWVCLPCECSNIQYIFHQYWLKAATCTSQKLFSFAVPMIPVKTKQFWNLSRNSFKWRNLLAVCNEG